MNEHLNSNSIGNTDARDNRSEQLYAAGAQREPGSVQAGTIETRRRALDTGSRGWRYVYQTH